MQFQTYEIFKKRKKIEIRTFFKCAPNFSLWKWKHNETKLVEKYYWALTQAAALSFRD